MYELSVRALRLFAAFRVMGNSLGQHVVAAIARMAVKPAAFRLTSVTAGSAASAVPCASLVTVVTLGSAARDVTPVRPLVGGPGGMVADAVLQSQVRNSQSRKGSSSRSLREEAAVMGVTAVTGERPAALVSADNTERTEKTLPHARVHRRSLLKTEGSEMKAHLPGSTREGWGKLSRAPMRPCTARRLPSCVPIARNDPLCRSPSARAASRMSPARSPARADAGRWQNSRDGYRGAGARMS